MAHRHRGKKRKENNNTNNLKLIKINISSFHLSLCLINTCIKRSSFGTRKKWYFMTGDILTEVQLI